METFFYNSYFIACVLFAIVINYVLCRVDFYKHIDFSGRRYYHIDGIRGVAAIFVVMNHAVFSFTNNGFDPQSIKNENFWVFAHAGDIGVQIFFCITGFLFIDKIIKTKNNIEWLGFFVSRVKRLVPLYFIASTIVLVLTLKWATGEQPFIDTVRQAINLYGFGFMGADIWVNGFRTYSLNAVIWTLPYEWRFYCALPIICAFLAYRKFIIPAILLVGLYALNDLYSGQVVWVYFISGAVAAYLLNNTLIPNSISNGNIIYQLTYTLIVISSLIFLLNSSFSGYGYERFLITSTLFIFIVLTKPKFLTFKPLVYLGEASYSSYLLHLIINALMIRLISRFINLNNVSSFEFYSIVAALVAVTTYVTAYSFKYVEFRFLKK
ncbi:acyltransferase [Cedecea neteri]|uniref:acyltransferase family protein n=1 Tax=Cedecea neteri TaxID=158822 RepID=UPI002899DDF7|nr:acyltransferase [Cedecea neteri]